MSASMIKRAALAVAAVGLIAAMSTPAIADIVAYKADLTGSVETPPNDSKGQGTILADFDTAKNILSWTATYTDLTGPATAAHFHGPAAVGAKAPPTLPIKGELTSPIKGSATLTAKQVKELEAGEWYFNVHTAKHPDGEIRGQLAK